MNPGMKISLARTVLLVFVLSIVIPVSAQQSVDDDSQTPDAVSASVEQIRVEIADYYQLEAQLEEVEPGFQRLLQSRLDLRVSEIFERVDALARELLESDRSDPTIDEYSAQTV
jgi:hypothetical protein